MKSPISHRDWFLEKMYELAPPPLLPPSQAVKHQHKSSIEPSYALPYYIYTASRVALPVTHTYTVGCLRQQDPKCNIRLYDSTILLR